MNENQLHEHLSRQYGSEDVALAVAEHARQKGTFDKILSGEMVAPQQLDALRWFADEGHRLLRQAPPQE